MWGKLLSEKEIQRLQHWLMHEKWIFNKCYLFGEKKTLRRWNLRRGRKKLVHTLRTLAFPLGSASGRHSLRASPRPCPVLYPPIQYDGHLLTCTLPLGSAISLMPSSLKRHWTLSSWPYRGKKPRCGEGKWCSQGFISNKRSQRRRSLQRPGPPEKKMPPRKRNVSPNPSIITI